MTFVLSSLTQSLTPQGPNADIPLNIDVFFVDEFDPHASSIGARGIGELGATGVAPAITNAVWHATGKRLRKVPIHIADILKT